MSYALVLTAAGNSTRMGGETKKEYLSMNRDGPSARDGNITVLSSALHAFLSTRLFSFMLITVPEGGEAEARRVLSEDRRVAPLLEAAGISLLFAEGGGTRQESVRNGIEALARLTAGAADPPGIVLIHDAARPWISPDTIRAVLDGTILHGAAVPGIPPVDTQKEIDETGKIVRHLERERIVSVQTPQGFRLHDLLAAHRRAAEDGRAYTDDTEIWGRYAGGVHVCAGDRNNRKVTYRGDL